MGYIRSLAIFLIFCTTACGPAVPGMTQTPDACAGATDAGARQKFSFEQITPCMNTPPKVSAFMANNMKQDGNYDFGACGENCYYPAALVYQTATDDSDGFAILQCYFLERNGWDAHMLGLSIETPMGHNVCEVNTPTALLILDDLGQMPIPYPALADVAKFYAGKQEMTPGGSLRSLEASQVTQVTTDHSSPNVLGLPWISVQY